jgi:hypothetical protein
MGKKGRERHFFQLEKLVHFLIGFGKKKAFCLSTELLKKKEKWDLIRVIKDDKLVKYQVEFT